MPRYIDAELVPALFDEEYKKTRKLISQGEDHLDILAEGFSEAASVIRKMPAADVVPRSTIKEIFALIWDAFQSTYYDSEFEEKFDEIEKKYTEEGK
ncbi:MAG: hypothetical protein E7609_08005 [Ruminococcaceae bacterium]|nr:hypothetical protein [Oscillospiraceae bacterium]